MEKVRDKLFKNGYDPYNAFPIEKQLDLQGWGSESPTFRKVISDQKPRLIIEVGTWKGGSAIHMAGLCKEIYEDNNFEIVCIDTFLGSEEHWDRFSYTMNFKFGRPDLYETFLSNVILLGHNDVITPFPVDSNNGWRALRNLGVKADMVYIDAGHDYEAVKSDILGYLEVLSDSGVLVGDDIHHPPIVRACDELLPGWTRMNDKFVWSKTPKYNIWRYES